MSTSSNTSLQEKEDVSLIKIASALFGVIALRMFLDNLAYPGQGAYFFSLERFVQEPLYFFSVFFSFSILTYFFTKSSFKNIFPFIVKVFLFILVIPLIDLALSGKVVDATQYVYIETNGFLTTYLNLMIPSKIQGITIGQQIGSFFIFASIAWFVYKKTSSIFKSLLSMLSGYTILFFYAILPSMLTLFNNKNILHDPIVHNAAQTPTLEAYIFILKQSWLMHAIENSNLLISSIDPIHEIAMAQLFWILIIIQILIIFFIANRLLWNALKNNFPATRFIYWFIIAAIGIVISQKLFGSINLQNPINFVSLLVFLLLIMANIWFAVFVNDAEDVEIDKISNPDRPLVKKEASLQEWNLMQTITLIIIAFGTVTMNRAVGFLLIFAQAAYYIYSARPLRLKRNFVFSSITIGLASVFIAMAGFFLVSPDQHFSSFPIKAILIIGISYALLSNLKDIKDFEGDKEGNIKTMPVFFGLEKSKYIIATLCSLVIFVVPLLLKTYPVLPVSICASLFLFYLFTRKKYQEKYIFLVLFLYVIFLFFITL